jgi:hypothetical protein
MSNRSTKEIAAEIAGQVTQSDSHMTHGVVQSVPSTQTVAGGWLASQPTQQDRIQAALDAERSELSAAILARDHFSELASREANARAVVADELATARLTIDCLKARLKLYEPVDSVLMGGMSAE